MITFQLCVFFHNFVWFIYAKFNQIFIDIASLSSPCSLSGSGLRTLDVTKHWSQILLLWIVHCRFIHLKFNQHFKDKTSKTNKICHGVFPFLRTLRRTKDARLAGHRMSLAIGWIGDTMDVLLHLIVSQCQWPPYIFYQFWELCEEKCNILWLDSAAQWASAICTAWTQFVQQLELEGNKNKTRKTIPIMNNSSWISWLIDLATGVSHSGTYFGFGLPYMFCWSFERLCVTFYTLIIIFQWSKWESWRNEREAY